MARMIQARLLVRYGEHRAGETIKGELARDLVAKGFAIDVTPKNKPKAAAKKKGHAPENKDFDPNAG